MPLMYDRIRDHGPVTGMQEGGGVNFFENLIGLIGGSVEGLAGAAQANAATQQNDPFAGLDINSLLGLDGGLGSLGQNSSSTSQGTSQSSQSQVVLPPALELLQEMRMRREAEANQAATIADIMSANPPRGQRFYMGFEPGGFADVLLGIITGNGVDAAQGILPMDQRLIRRTDIPIPMGQPDVAEDFGAAHWLGNLILEAMKNVPTGGSSSQQSSQSGSTPVALPASTPSVTPPSTGLGGAQQQKQSGIQ